MNIFTRDGGTARKSTDDNHEEGGRIIHNIQTQLLKYEWWFIPQGILDVKMVEGDSVDY